MVSVKVSREWSIIVSSVNTNQVGQSMSRGRNEHSVESEMEGIRKGYIYISALLFQIYIIIIIIIIRIIKRYKKNGTVVPVPL